MLTIQHLTKHYRGSNKGVTDLSLTVEPGDIYGFIGHNGAGKTTTLKCIAGIHGFDEGEIIINGFRLKEDPLACKRSFAYIPDNPDLFEYLTGVQYLDFIADVPDAALSFFPPMFWTWRKSFAARWRSLKTACLSLAEIWGRL